MRAETLTLSKAAYCNILRACIEEPKEPNGFIYGHQEGRKIFVTNSYPLQTAIRRPKTTSHGNNSAMKRIKSLDMVLGEGNKSAFIGGFHSHVFKRLGDGIEKATADKLGEYDIEYILEQLASSDLDRWIEVLVKVKETESCQVREKKHSLRNFRHKAQATIGCNERRSYVLTFSTYSISKEGRVEELISRVSNGFKHKR